MPPRDVQALPIAPETLVLRSRTWDRLKFEAEYALQRGTTANSYLLRGDRTALFDPPGESFTEPFLKALGDRLDFAQLDYIVLGHANRNRSETLAALLPLAPQAAIVCSNPAALILRDLVDPLPEIQVVKGGSTLDLGRGHRLEFLLVPTPRWPDQLCTYDPKTGILYTDKYFGAHVCGDQIFDEGWSVYSTDRRHYFDCLLAPSAAQVAVNLAKLYRKPATLYATGHGPLVRHSRAELGADYRKWIAEQRNRTATVTVLYASAYGNTATVADAIARGLTASGIAVEKINCESAAPDTIREAIARSAGFAVGSPTLGGHLPTQIQTALGIVLSTADKSQLAGVFGSYGWSGEAVDLLEGKVRDAGYARAFEPIRVKFAPTDEVLAECERAGAEFARALKQQSKRSTQLVSSESQAERTEQAVGRVIGSLCAVLPHADPTRAMLVSWVSQATFDPPGLTIALSRESNLSVQLKNGDRFTLNVLPEDGTTRKRLLKQHAIGKELTELELETSNDLPVLNDALAYLDCRTENSMVCGDHRLVYAIATAGKVLDTDRVTALHHRKSGSHY